MKIRILAALGAAIGLLVPGALRAQTWRAPADPEIRKILAERIDVQRNGAGIVVGVITPEGRRIIAHGARAKGDPVPLDGRTVFEIGSVTKVFTGLLLAEMAQNGEVQLDQPVADLLPDFRIPERNGRKITLVDLATQTSALPRLAGDMRPADPANPYADYTVEQLKAFLASHELARDIGSQYEYSNLGMGLLGQALARRAGTDYETLVRRRIGEPLGMTDTAVTLSSSQRTRLATGHTAQLEPTGLWDLPTLAGAGALRSTANDMLTFLEAQMGLKPHPLTAAMQAQVAPAVRRPAGRPMTIGLGWHIRPLPRGGEVVWHNGGTGGYRSFVGYNPATREGVVVLTNTSTAVGGDDIGMHLLSGSPLQKLQPPSPTRTTVAVPVERLVGLIGRYRLAPDFFLEITGQGGRLFAKATGQGAAEIFPEGEDRWFYKVVDAQLTFLRGPDGRATKVTLHQNGANVPGLRVD